MYAWSSTNSWGGNNPPGEGEIVVIPAGMTILLDQSTPTLKMLLIQGKLLAYVSLLEIYIIL
jgi:type VI protein secretion system component Hcp